MHIIPWRIHSQFTQVTFGSFGIISFLHYWIIVYSLWAFTHARLVWKEAHPSTELYPVKALTHVHPVRLTDETEVINHLSVRQPRLQWWVPVCVCVCRMILADEPEIDFFFFQQSLITVTQDALLNEQPAEKMSCGTQTLSRSCTVGVCEVRDMVWIGWQMLASIYFK